jgi:hypothetical protein
LLDINSLKLIYTTVKEELIRLLKTAALSDTINFSLANHRSILINLNYKRLILYVRLSEKSIVDLREGVISINR